jgi:hypothetical protein
MASKFNFRTHEPIRKAGQVTGYRTQPSVRLRVGDGPGVHIQGGKFFGEGGGGELTEAEIPGWLEGEIAKMSPAARRSVGLPDPKPEPEPEPEPQKVKSSKKTDPSLLSGAKKDGDESGS